MGNVSAAAAAALALILLASLLAIVSMATDHWSEYKYTIGSFTPYKAYRGLTKVCVTSGSTNTCNRYTDAKDYADYLKACLGAMVLGFLCTAGAFVIWIFWILGLCSSGTIMKVLKVLTIILLSVGLFWIVIAVIVYAAKDEDESKQSGLAVLTEYKLDWSWGIAIAVAVLQAMGLIMICFAARKEA